MIIIDDSFLKKEDLTFIVWTQSNLPKVGGYVVLHSLARKLSRLGYRVLITTEPLFKDEGVEILQQIKENVWDTSNLDLENTVVIYPEIIYGNPLSQKNVARWILYDMYAANRPEAEKTWKDTDRYYKLHEYFRTTKNKPYKKLEAYDFKLDLFFDKGQSRKGYCHLNYKKYNSNKDEDLAVKYNSIHIKPFLDNHSFEELNDELNKYEYFITYDDATYYSIIAALSGCKSIIIKKEDSIPDIDFYSKMDVYKYGIAYGWENLNHAIKTLPLLRNHLLEIEKNTDNTIQSFVDDWKQILRDNDEELLMEKTRMFDVANLKDGYYSNDMPRCNRLFGLRDLLKYFNISKEAIACEIGSYGGVSSDLISRYVKVLYCCDPWLAFLGPNGQYILDAFNLVKFKRKNIKAINKWSHDAATDFDDATFDFLYLDADHSYQAALSDIKRWVPKVKINGVFAGHDYVSDPSQNIFVKKAADELIGEENIKFFEDSSWGFIVTQELSNRVKNANI